MKKGIDKKTILQSFANNYKNSTKTFYNYYDLALIEYQKFSAKAQPIIEAKEIEALGEIAKAGILSKAGRQLILTQIAEGTLILSKYIVCDGIIEEKPIVPNYSERKAAIAELNKMDGAYAAEEDHSGDISEIKVIRIGNGT
jgi:hypothetical protein